MARKRLPKIPPGKPPEYIFDLKSALADKFQARNDTIDHLMELRFREHTIKIPPQFRATAEEVKTPIVDDMVTRIVNDITASPITVNVPVIRQSEDAQKASSRLEKWTNATWQRLDSQTAPRRVSRDLVDTMAMTGTGVSKLLWVPHAWRSYDEAVAAGPNDDDLDERGTLDERKREDRLKSLKIERLPFAWRSLDPRTIYPHYRDGELEAVLEVSRREVFDVVDRYDVGRDESGRLISRYGESFVSEGDVSTRSCEWVEYWDRRQCAYYADGQLVTRFEHGYGRPPYFLFYGLMTGDRRPEYAARSVAARLVGLVESFDRALTMLFNWMFAGSFPMGVIQRSGDAASPLGDTGEALEPLEWSPGEFVQLQPGEEIRWIEPPRVGDSLNRTIELLLDMIHQYGLPPLGRGFGSGESGYQVNQLLAQIKSFYNPIAQNYAVSLEELTKHLWAMAKYQIREDIPVWNEYLIEGKNREQVRNWQVLEVGPSDITHFNVIVTINPDVQTNQIAMQQAGLQAWQSGALPLRYTLENFFSIPNPDDLIEEREVEDFFNSPELKAARFQEYLKETQLAQEQAKAEAAALQQAAMGLPEAQGPMGALLGGDTGPVGPMESMTGGPPGMIPDPGLGGRPAGQQIQPNTQMAPGGLPGMGEPQVGEPF